MQIVHNPHLNQDDQTSAVIEIHDTFQTWIMLLVETEIGKSQKKKKKSYVLQRGPCWSQILLSEIFSKIIKPGLLISQAM